MVRLLTRPSTILRMVPLLPPLPVAEVAVEAAPYGVTVNAVAAGIFDTDLGHSLPDYFKQMYESWNMKGRFGKPEELAEFAAFLVSERNSYMTGEVVILDGGCVV